MNISGLNAYHGDSAVVLIVDGITAVPLTHFRHTGSRAAAIRYPVSN